MLSLWFVFSLCNLFSSHHNHYLSLCGNFLSLLFVSVVFFVTGQLVSSLCIVSSLYGYSASLCIFFVSVRSFCVSLQSLLPLCCHFASLCSRLLSLSFFHLFVYWVCVFVSLWLFIYLLVGFFHLFVLNCLFTVILFIYHLFVVTLNLFMVVLLSCYLFLFFVSLWSAARWRPQIHLSFVEICCWKTSQPTNKLDVICCSQSWDWNGEKQISRFLIPTAWSYLQTSDYSNNEQFQSYGKIHWVHVICVQMFYLSMVLCFCCHAAGLSLLWSVISMGLT